MSGTQAASEASKQKFDNNGQYSRNSILRYEKIFGDNYISTGGPETTDNLTGRLQGFLKPGVRVLDVGSGIGGAAFHLVEKYGAQVVGIDLAEEMIAVGHERATTAGMSDKVQFILGDVLETTFPEKFDLAWSRDAFMHIPDKKKLFTTLFGLLKPGGKLIITDYARGKTPGSHEFEDYIKKTGYSVIEPEQYGKVLESVGFTDVVVDDATETFVDILKREERRLVEERQTFLSDFSEKDLDYLVDRWNMKIGFCKAGDMKWGIYLATKPA
ncbi:methyltransferase domain-containing protein [Paludisphaera rhizosphaerae]|uniref:methyltransferase domain-containing protein n=1 Tax=Paludisphaera rhizosphaerae TaxID=2711216 RepID=UPI0013EE1C02|nr:methyltransferase domain-containing protein [Paludisphaera rhizosphaerae]